MSTTTDADARGASPDPDSPAAPADVSAEAHTGPSRTGLGRRALLGFGGAVVAAGAAGAVAGRVTAPSAVEAAASSSFSFTGAHQAGITTPAQDRLYLAAFDMTSTSKDDLVTLLRTWTTMAARLTSGKAAGELGATSGPYDAPPEDTGEAMDLPTAGLTLTIGFGRSLFVGADGQTDRFGIGDKLPDALVALPHFSGDDLDPARSDGDLIVQACADDQQVAVHAIRNLSRAAFGIARIRWTQLGYGRTSSTSTAQLTPRNLFGFKDGTANIMAEETAALAEHVWVPADDLTAPSAWLTGGTYLVARRIRMTMETWDRSSLREQERTIGRTKATGAPLSGGHEHTAPDFTATGRAGAPLIDVASHVRLAHPSSNDDHRMLRRGYTFTDGNDALGRLDAGLMFLAFVRDPRVGYIPVQRTLATTDLLSEYLKHTGSGLFAVPPGVATIGADGQVVGQDFLGSALVG